MGDLVGSLELNGTIYNVQALHDVPNLIDDCCSLINLEWKRSITARLRSIEGSCENFPMSLIIIKSAKKSEVVGHCKISRLSFSNTKVFIQTVVIHPNLRGKGLGKFIMNAAEEVCRRKGIRWIYLTTQKSQENFYRKLGYIECPPITIYGSQVNDSMEEIREEKDLVFKNNNDCKILETIPPPPPLPHIFIKTEGFIEPCPKIFMKKEVLFK